MWSRDLDRQPVANRQLTLDGLPALRDLACEIARAAGLSDEQTGRFAVVVDEAMTNAVRYAGGGQLTVTVDDVRVVAEVRDHGPGIPAGTRIELPTPRQLSGRGLWLIHSLSDEVAIDTGPHGTTVRLTMRVSAPATDAAGG